MKDAMLLIVVTAEEHVTVIVVITIWAHFLTEVRIKILYRASIIAGYIAS